VYCRVTHYINPARSRGCYFKCLMAGKTLEVECRVWGNPLSEPGEVLPRCVRCGGARLFLGQTLQRDEPAIVLDALARAFQHDGPVEGRPRTGARLAVAPPFARHGFACSPRCSRVPACRQVPRCREASEAVPVYASAAQSNPTSISRSVAATPGYMLFCKGVTQQMSFRTLRDRSQNGLLRWALSRLPGRRYSHHR